MSDRTLTYRNVVAVAVLVLLAVAVAGPVMARPVEDGEAAPSWWADTLAWISEALGLTEPPPEPEPVPPLPPDGGEAGGGGETDGGGGKWDPDG